jgi:hypothetical protein
VCFVVPVYAAYIHTHIYIYIQIDMYAPGFMVARIRNCGWAVRSPVEVLLVGWYGYVVFSERGDPTYTHT